MGVARIGWVAIGLGAALALSACGNSKTASAGAGNAVPADDSEPAPAAAVAAPNACDVLTEAIAKKYLGDAAQLKRKAQPNPKMTQCQWGDDHGAITVEVGPWDTVYTKTGEDKPAGFGDEAYDTPSGLYVRKGAVGLSIDVIVASGEFWGTAADDVESQTVAAEHKVAPDLIARLGS
jgi:hypothetical protein